MQFIDGNGCECNTSADCPSDEALFEDGLVLAAAVEDVHHLKEHESGQICSPSVFKVFLIPLPFVIEDADSSCGQLRGGSKKRSRRQAVLGLIWVALASQLRDSKKKAGDLPLSRLPYFLLYLVACYPISCCAGENLTMERIKTRKVHLSKSFFIFFLKKNSIQSKGHFFVLLRATFKDKTPKSKPFFSFSSIPSCFPHAPERRTASGQQSFTSAKARRGRF